MQPKLQKVKQPPGESGLKIVDLLAQNKSPEKKTHWVVDIHSKALRPTSQATTRRSDANIEKSATVPGYQGYHYTPFKTTYFPHLLGRQCSEQMLWNVGLWGSKRYVASSPKKHMLCANVAWSNGELLLLLSKSNIPSFRMDVLICRILWRWGLGIVKTPPRTYPHYTNPAFFPLPFTHMIGAKTCVSLPCCPHHS